MVCGLPESTIRCPEIVFFGQPVPGKYSDIGSELEDDVHMVVSNFICIEKEVGMVETTDVYKRGELSRSLNPTVVYNLQLKKSCITPIIIWWTHP